MKKELELYDSNLVDKPSILAINKIDQDLSNEKVNEFMERYNDYESQFNKLILNSQRNILRLKIYLKRKYSKY